MDRSLKLKLPGPKPDMEPQEGYDFGESDGKQCPKCTDGGCMAASGDECSIAVGENLSVTQ